MAKDFKKELQGIEEYLKSDAGEDAKTHLVYPLFKALFGRSSFITDSSVDAHGYSLLAIFDT